MFVVTPGIKPAHEAYRDCVECGTPPSHLRVQTLFVLDDGSAVSGGSLLKNEANAPRPPLGSMLFAIEKALQPRAAKVTLHRQRATCRQWSRLVHGIVKSVTRACVPERPVRAVWHCHGVSSTVPLP